MQITKADQSAHLPSLISDFVIASKECMIQSNLCKTSTLKRPKIGFQDQLLLNAGQKYCRMLQGEHSAIALWFTIIKLPFVIKIFVLYNFEWPFYTGFTVPLLMYHYSPTGLINSTKHEHSCNILNLLHF